jgi:molybdopterin/thiamine biosynthesis adenylyltransferase/rhodanese-related sulfurtransferase
MQTSLIPSELERYSRHLLLPEIQLHGQEKLKQARVLVIGAGGLGSPVLLYLAAAGVGTIGIAEFDTIDVTNLQRQVLYSTKEIGQPKAEVAKEKLLALNPHINVVLHPAIDAKNALGIIQAYDLVADGSDNFSTRYLVSDACEMLGKPYVYASVFRFEGQVSVFNLSKTDGSRGPGYRDLFPDPPAPEQVPNCSEGGVLGILPGMIGTMQANEVIKIITGVGDPLTGKLLLLDALSMQTRVIRFSRNPERKIPAVLQEEAIYCQAPSAADNFSEIEAEELERWLQKGEDFLLIDVRELYEREIASIGGEHVPLAKIVSAQGKVAASPKVVFYCRSGARSKKAVEQLQEAFGFRHLYSLKGGILAWIDEIDPSLSSY